MANLSSRSESYTSSNIPPPPVLVHDPGAADRARSRFTPKSRLSKLISLPNLRKKPFSNVPKRSHDDVFQEIDDNANTESFSVRTQSTETQIYLDKLDSDINEDIDRYEWAILYENQRGITMFSVPYYSSLSLLPSDPSPFTFPNTSGNRSKQPPVNLSNYPLPDGNWQWVSRSWMIDMRSDSGEVQHDGFEYNWTFRQHDWRARVGVLSSGGWVRRRRWVRLMMRPAKQKHQTECVSGRGTPITSSNSDDINDTKLGRSVSSPSLSLNQFVDYGKVWVGDDPEADWQRCRCLLKNLGRDGLKLEIWKIWIGFYHPAHRDKFSESKNDKKPEKQWTEDDIPTPSKSVQGETKDLRLETITPPLKHFIIPVLRLYGQDILRSFVYPDSRAQFLKILALGGMLEEEDVKNGLEFDAKNTDFWSYTSGLAVY